MDFAALSSDDKLLALHRQLLEIQVKTQDVLARLAQIEIKIAAIQKAGSQ